MCLGNTVWESWKHAQFYTKQPRWDTAAKTKFECKYKSFLFELTLYCILMANTIPKSRVFIGKVNNYTLFLVWKLNRIHKNTAHQSYGEKNPHLYRGWKWLIVCTVNFCLFSNIFSLVLNCVDKCFHHSWTHTQNCQIKSVSLWVLISFQHFAVSSKLDSDADGESLYCSRAKSGKRNSSSNH